ncbi:MAG: response regulator [Desulfobacteraceae bacterium]|nr:response regulator [Desulfobacteraceae bacterium]
MNNKKHNGNLSEQPSEKAILAVIDDEQKWLKVYKRMFRNSNYFVDTYSDPQIFLDTIAKYPNKFAGIICDIKMPKISGHEVFETIKKNPRTRNIPFLIVSGVLTQNQNLSKVQPSAYVSKMEDNLRAKIFEELIEVVENWPKIRQYLYTQNVAEEDINFFCQFFINYQTFFNEILKYIHQMEQACINSDDEAMAQTTERCMIFMDDIHNRCMSIIFLMQECPEMTNFIKKICIRGRSSVNMIQNFQMILSEKTYSNNEFQEFLQDCRESLQKIILGTEQGYNLREVD